MLNKGAHGRVSAFAVVSALAVAACSAQSSDERSAHDTAHLDSATCASAADWAPNVAYTTGEAVRYQGTVYRVVQGHTSLSVWPPDLVPALFAPTDCTSPSPSPTPNPTPNPTPDPTPDPPGDAGSTPPPSPPPTPNPPGGGSGGKVFVGYYQTWSDGWKANGADTALAHMPSYVNVVNLSFMEPNTNYTAGSMSLGGTGIGVPYDGPTLKDAIAALHANQPGARVLVSVGGATFPNFGSFNANAIAAFVKDFGLDGVDIDYEPANPSCTNGGGSVTCPSDSEYVSVIHAMRSALPRPYWVTIAGWSVGAYGEGQWASAPPASAYMGIALAALKQAGSDIDLVNVMSYDASPAFDPVEAMHAYQHYYGGKIAMGIEVPPEAWGGHIETVGEIDTLADAVNSSGAAGLMLWSIQKPGPAQEFATEMCVKLNLGNCSSSL